MRTYLDIHLQDQTVQSEQWKAKRWCDPGAISLPKSWWKARRRPRIR